MQLDVIGSLVYSLCVCEHRGRSLMNCLFLVSTRWGKKNCTTLFLQYLCQNVLQWNDY